MGQTSGSDVFSTRGMPPLYSQVLLFARSRNPEGKRPACEGKIRSVVDTFDKLHVVIPVDQDNRRISGSVPGTLDEH